MAVKRIHQPLCAFSLISDSNLSTAKPLFKSYHSNPVVFHYNTAEPYSLLPGPFLYMYLLCVISVNKWRIQTLT